MSNKVGAVKTAKKMKLKNNVEMFERVDLAAVKRLEEISKCGFFCEQRPQDEELLEIQVRLCCESKNGDDPAEVLTPFCSVQTLSNLIDGCIYLQPLLLKVIKDRQSNAPKPEE